MSGSRAKTRRKSLYLSTVTLVGVVCFALVTLDGFRAWQAYRAQLAETASETDNLARSLAQHVGDAIQTIDTGLAGMKQRLESGGIEPGLIGRLRQTMVAQVNSTRTIFSFALFDANGASLTSSRAVSAPVTPDAVVTQGAPVARDDTIVPRGEAVVQTVDLSTRGADTKPLDTKPGAANILTADDRDFFAYWRTHDDGRAFIGGPYRAKTDEKWIMTVSRRVNAADGSFAGVVVGSIALDTFKDFYASFDIGQHGILLLTRDDGTIVVRWPFDPTYIGRKAIDPTLFPEIIPTSVSGHFANTSRIDGVTRLGSFRHVTDYPLVVLAAFDRSEVLADWWSEAGVYGAGVLLVVVIIGLLGVRLTRKIADDGRHNDERLRRSEKMEVIGRLAAGVAHDFNNILQVIMGGMEILRDEKSLSPQAQAFINEIEGAANRGSSLTHHLLSYSRKQVLSPQLLDPGKTLDGLRLVLSRTLRSNIGLTIAVEPAIALIEADPGQLQTALINLAINAAHAMPEGGTLRCEARTDEAKNFGEIRAGSYVVIAISDTGVGMTPEILSQAFDPFFTTRGLEGSGLGLPMVQGFSRQSGGDVRVLTAPGEGTSVEIWLPAVPAPPPVAVVEDAAPTRCGRVLLVDDSPDVLVTVDASLRRGGFTVRQAGNGYEALAALATGEKFDVLVTDYMMPGLNGLALVKEARGFQPDLPALIISGFADANGVAIDEQDVSFLRKPFQREQLLARVSALIPKIDQRMRETAE